MSSFASNDDEATAFMCFLYIILGFLSALCNILNISVWLSNRELRQKHIYLLAIDLSEIVNAIGYVLVGTGRGLALLHHHFSTPISIRQCFFERYWPHLLILGTQLPSYGIILMSCERLCAVLRPTDYNRLFTGYSKLALLLMVPIAGLISLMIGGWSVIGTAGDEEFSSQHCAIIASTATWYSTFHFVIIVLAYVVSFISILVVWKMSKRTSKGKIGGDNRFGVMLIITGTSIPLVGSDSVVMLLIRWNITTFSDTVLAVTHAMPACLSMFNTLINFAFRSEFRKQFLVMLGLRTPTYQTQSVRPLTIVVRPTNGF